jgi:hypothetical protein
MPRPQAGPPDENITGNGVIARGATELIEGAFEALKNTNPMLPYASRFSRAGPASYPEIR